MISIVKYAPFSIISRVDKSLENSSSKDIVVPIGEVLARELSINIMVGIFLTHK
jgi:hypothetical protein